MKEIIINSEEEFENTVKDGVSLVDFYADLAKCLLLLLRK